MCDLWTHWCNWKMKCFCVFAQARPPPGRKTNPPAELHIYVFPVFLACLFALVPLVGRVAQDASKLSRGRRAATEHREMVLSVWPTACVLVILIWSSCSAYETVIYNYMMSKKNSDWWLANQNNNWWLEHYPCCLLQSMIPWHEKPVTLTNSPCIDSTITTVHAAIVLGQWQQERINVH